MVRSQKKGVFLSLLSGILWAAYSVTLYSWLSPYNGDSGTLDSARGVMFIILAAIGIAWIDALITFVFEVGYVAKRGKLKEYLRLLRTKAFSASCRRRCLPARWALCPSPSPAATR